MLTFNFTSFQMDLNLLNKDVAELKAKIAIREDEIIGINHELAALKEELKGRMRLIEAFHEQDEKIKKYEFKVSKARSDLTEVIFLFKHFQTLLSNFFIYISSHHLMS